MSGIAPHPWPSSSRSEDCTTPPSLTFPAFWLKNLLSRFRTPVVSPLPQQARARLTERHHPPYQNEHSCLPIRMLGPPGKVPTCLKNAFFYLPSSNQDPKSHTCMGVFCLLGLSCSRPVLCPVFRPLTAEDVCYSSGKMTVLPPVSPTCVWLPITGWF